MESSIKEISFADEGDEKEKTVRGLWKSILKKNSNYFSSTGNAEEREKMKAYISKRVMSGRLPTAKSIRQESLREKGLGADSSDSDDSDDSDDDADETVESKKKDISYNIVYTILSYQFSFVRRVWKELLRKAAKSGKSMIYNAIPKQQVLTFFYFIVYTYVFNTSFLIAFVPFALFCYSLSTMFASTLQAVHGERHFQKFLAWSDSLRSIDVLINAKEAEENYILKHQSPTRRFITGLVVTLMFHPFCISFLPSSYFSIISIFMFAISMWSFVGVIGPSSLASLLLGVAVHLSRQFDWFTADRVGVLLFGFLRISFGLDAILRILQLVFFVAIPYSNIRHKKTVNIASKHVIIKRDYRRQLFLTVWLELSMLFFKSTGNLYELVSAFTHLAVALFFFPFACVWLVLSVFKQLATFLDMYLVAALLAAVVLGACLIFFKPHLGRYPALMRKYVIEQKLVLIVVFIIVTLLSSSSSSQHNDDQLAAGNLLSLDEYARSCLDKMTGPQQQIACHHLTGFNVKWKGKVQKVELASVKNQARDFVSTFPGVVSDLLTCLLGDRYPEDCQQKRSPDDDNKYLCQVAISNMKRGKECHLDRYDDYNFVLGVNSLSAVSERDFRLILKAGHDFKDAILKISSGDNIEFQATVADNATELDLISLEKLNGRDVLIESELNKFMPLVAVECAFNFVFSPVLKIEYQIKENGCIPAKNEF